MAPNPDPNPGPNSGPDPDEPEHKDHGMRAFGILLFLAVIVLLTGITVSGMDKFG